MDKIQISIDGGATWQEFEGGCHEFNAEITPESLAFIESTRQQYEVSCTVNITPVRKYFRVLYGNIYTPHQLHCIERRMARERRAARLAAWVERKTLVRA